MILLTILQNLTDVKPVVQQSPDMERAFYIVIGAVVAGVVGLAAFITALGVIYAKVIKPVVTSVKEKVLVPLNELQEKIGIVSESVNALTTEVSNLKTLTQGFEAVSMGEQIRSVKQELAYNSFKHRLTSRRAITPIFIMDDKGNVTFANKAICRMFGVDPDLLLQLNWLQLVAAGDREEILELWQAAYKNLSIYDNRQRMLVHGELKRVRVTAEPFIYQGKVLNYYGVCSVDGETPDTGIHATGGA